MKILHIIDTLGPGGAQILLKGIFEKYQNSNFYLFVLRKTDTIIPINHTNVIFSKSYFKYSIKSFCELKKIISKNKIDILHCHLLKSQIFTFVLKQLFFPKIKVIFHEHGEIFINNRTIFKYFMKNSQKKVNLYVATSNATKNALVSKTEIDKTKITVLFNYILSENFTKKQIKINIPEIKLKYNISKHEIILGYAGRLSQEKGCEYLIKSLPFVDKKIKLLIAGERKEEKNLKQIIRNLKIEKKVIFLGYITDMMTFYPLIDIFIIPSEHESFGLTAIESQAMGIPVIASNIPGLNEIVEDKKNGLLFEAKKLKDLAQKINTLINNQNIKEDLIKGGLENAKKYQIEDYYQKLLNIYTFKKTE